MKKVLLTVLVYISIPLFLFAQNETGIKFTQTGSWAETLAKAKAEGKYIFADIYTTWCGPCKMMDSNVYPDQQLGVLMNDRYISVKIQMDSTAKDNEHIRSWYTDAAQMMHTAKIEAFPTLLFYSSEGELLVKAIGYKDVPALTIVANFASNKEAVKQFNKDLDAYKTGIREYPKMIALSRTVKEILKDDKLALQIATDYKTGYLDKLDMAQFYTKENVAFIRENDMELVSVNDNFFKLCYNEPGKIDTILGKGMAARYVTLVIARDEVRSRLYKDGKVITKSPNWPTIKKVITEHYSKIDADDFMLSQKISFYHTQGQWDQYTFLQSYRIKRYPPKPGTLEVFYQLNDAAWNVFENCNVKIALERALSWSELSIKLEDDVQYLDTKANLLYKLNRINEAISLQEKALKRDKDEAKKVGKESIFPYISENLEKMKKREPTWITKQ